MRRGCSIGLMFLGIYGFASGLFAAIVAKPGEIARFAVNVASEVRAGETFKMKIEARDIYDNLLPDYDMNEREIELNVLGTGEFRPRLIKSTDFRDGKAMIACSYTKAEPIKIILKEKNSLALGSICLSVISGEASYFEVLSPSDVTVGQPFPVKLIVKDANGNCVTSFGEEEGLIKIKSDAEVRFSSNYLNRSSFKNGVALVNLRSYKTGKCTLFFADEGAKIEGRTSLEVRPGGFHHFEVVPPPTIVVGKPFKAIIKARDAYDNLLTSYDRQGQGAAITALGTGLIKPKFIPASSFDKGVATVNFVYTRAEPFTIVAEERAGKTGFKETLKEIEKQTLPRQAGGRQVAELPRQGESEICYAVEYASLPSLKLYSPPETKEPSLTVLEKEEFPISEIGYILGPGDVVKIEVWNEKEISGLFTIDERGRLSYPLLGDIKVSGLTRGQLDEVLTRALKKYLKFPQVTVTTKEFHSQKVTVLGEIEGKGVYPLKGPTRIFEFLSSLGGTTTDADISNVILIRERGTIHVIDLDKILFENDKRENLYLRGGDRIYIPSLEKTGQKTLWPGTN